MTDNPIIAAEKSRNAISESADRIIAYALKLKEMVSGNDSVDQDSLDSVRRSLVLEQKKLEQKSINFRILAYKVRKGLSQAAQPPKDNVIRA